MDSTEQLITEIRGVLASGAQVARERLVELAGAYSAGVEKVLQKAWYCRDLLNGGLRGRALRVARRDGDLKEEFERTDFPELATWLDLCERLDLPLPPLMDAQAVATIVSEVYAGGSDGLEGLLGAYRRMSLGRAPLADRLRVLRMICREDPGEEAWAGDVKQFEEAYLERLVRRIDRVDREGDLPALERSLAELKGPEWITRPPAVLIEAVEERARPHRRRSADERYEALLGDARAAQSAMDEETCRLRMDLVGVIEDETGCLPGGTVAEQLGPIRQWLDDLADARERERAFQDACERLAGALNAPAGADGLERCAAAVMEFERPVPEALGSRLAARRERNRRRESRRFAVRLAAVAGSVLLVAGAVAGGAVWYGRHQAVSTWRQKIGKALEDGELELARTLLTDLEASAPRYWDDPRIRDVRGRYERKSIEEQERSRAFEALMAGTERPGFVETGHRGRSILDRADTLARGPDDWLRVGDARDRIEAFESKEQAQREREFGVRLVQLRDLLREVQAAYDRAADSFAASAEKADELATVLRDTPRMPASLTDALAAERRKLTDLREKWRLRAARASEADAALSRIVTLYGRPTELAAAARQFAATFDEHPAAADMRTCVRAAGLWEDELAWFRAVGKWASPTDVPDPATAQARLAAVDAYLKAHPTGLHAERAHRYRDFLSAAAAAWQDQELKHLTATRAMFRAPLLSRLFILTDAGGRNYYMLARKIDVISLDGKPWRQTIEYVTAPDLTTRRETFKGEAFTAEPKPAPHSALSERALEMLGADLREADWPVLYPRLAELAQDAEGLDPILRANLLVDLLAKVSDCGYADPKALKRTLTLLRSEEINYAWMDPKDAEANRNRARVAKLLKRLEPISALTAGVADRLKAVRSAVAFHEPVGIIAGPDGRPSLQRSVNAAELSILLLDPSGPLRTVIGHLKAGQFTPAPNVNRPPRGAIVYAKRR